MSKSKEKAKLSKLVNVSREGISECARCCTCCAKGGPALHKEDKELYTNNSLHGRFLFTIRKGEPAEDNVKGGLIFADTDIIKIKSKTNSSNCLYVDLLKNSCSIYDSRPLECRILKCWDTTDIETIYDKDRLTRKDLLGHIDGLWEIITDHQEECSYDKVRDLIDQNPEKLDKDAARKILEMIQYDATIRPMVLEKGNLDSNMLDFLFVIPIAKALKRLSLEF